MEGHLLSTDIGSSEREVLRCGAKRACWMHTAKGGEESNHHLLAAIATLRVMGFDTGENVVDILLKRAWLTIRFARRAFGAMLQAGEKVVAEESKLRMNQSMRRFRRAKRQIYSAVWGFFDFVCHMVISDNGSYDDKADSMVLPSKTK